MRISNKRLLAILKEAGVPYVEVDEAKRALFAGVRLKTFDFVVYSEVGANWLVTCRPFSAGEVRQTMESWQVTFGAGFVSVEARLRRGGIVLVMLDGTEIDPPWQPIRSPLTARGAALAGKALGPEGSERQERTTPGEVVGAGENLKLFS